MIEKEIFSIREYFIFFYDIIFAKCMNGRQQNMKYNLPERVIRDISTFAKKTFS